MAWVDHMLPNLITKLRARRAEMAPKEWKLGPEAPGLLCFCVEGVPNAYICLLPLSYATSPQAPA